MHNLYHVYERVIPVIIFACSRMHRYQLVTEEHILFVVILFFLLGCGLGGFDKLIAVILSRVLGKLIPLLKDLISLLQYLSSILAEYFSSY